MMETSQRLTKAVEESALSDLVMELAVHQVVERWRIQDGKEDGKQLLT